MPQMEKSLDPLMMDSLPTPLMDPTLWGSGKWTMKITSAWDLPTMVNFYQCPISLIFNFTLCNFPN